MDRPPTGDVRRTHRDAQRHSTPKPSYQVPGSQVSWGMLSLATPGLQGSSLESVTQGHLIPTGAFCINAQPQVHGGSVSKTLPFLPLQVKCKELLAAREWTGLGWALFTQA